MTLRALLLVVVIAGVPLPAQAHAFLERASPSAGQNLAVSPGRVELQFSEALEPSFSEVRVTDARGRDMSAGPQAVNGKEMDLPLKRLAPGRYRVTWRAVSVDAHRTEGKFNFLVGP
jgi:methionine-rich copper-binding protein CopC